MDCKNKSIRIQNEKKQSDNPFVPLDLKTIKRVKKIKGGKNVLKNGNQNLSCQDLKSASVRPRTEPHLNVVCPNGVPIDRKLCLLLSSHLQALSETLPPPYGRITMQVHPDHMIQLQKRETAWKTGRNKGGERQDEGKEASHRNWLRPHTQIKLNFAISNSLNMQKPQVKPPTSAPQTLLWRLYFKNNLQLSLLTGLLNAHILT